MRKEVRLALDDLKVATGIITSYPLEEEEFADVLGEVRFAETRLATYRQGTLAEAPPFQKGDNYELTTSYSNEYSYNTQAILADLADEDIFIQDLVRADAVELRWKLTQLRNILDASGVTTRVKPGELGPDDMTVDGPHMGKYKKPGYTRVVGRKQDEQ